MDPATIAQDTISGALATVFGGVLLAGLAWIAWPLRWKIQGNVIKKLIADERPFNFVYKPSTKASKELTFLSDGRIGKGAHANESTWRIRRGSLEIFASDQKIYSRFRYDRSLGILKHTNDPELRSNAGQYMEPRLEKITRGAA